MPIHKSQKHLYPKNWKTISKHIRYIRAGNRCEWCKAINHQPHPITGSKVVLTVAHLDHNPANCEPSNLAALCQRCHNNYDRPMRLLNRKTRKKFESKAPAKQLPLALDNLPLEVSVFILAHRKRFARLFPPSAKSLLKPK